MNKHLYEYHYEEEQNKKMFIRFVKNGKYLNGFSTQQNKYMYVRAAMDIHGIDFVLNWLKFLPKEDKNIVWLAWGHKSKLIRNVGLGDYTWPKK